MREGTACDRHPLTLQSNLRRGHNAITFFYHSPAHSASAPGRIRRHPMSANQALALRLAKAGYSVFPCRPDKRPLVKWRTESSGDPGQIIHMWARFPDAPPALDIEKSGIVVLDGDRHGGPDGVAALRGLLRANSADVRRHPVIKTPGDGVHVYFRQIDLALRNSPGNLPVGVDIKGAGGCVMAPGADLGGTRLYHPVEGCLSPFERERIPVAPQWLVEVVRPYREPLPPPPTPRDRTAYAMAVLKGECEEATMASNGTRQYALNKAAFKIGLKLISAGHLAPHDAECWLLQAAQANGLLASDGLFRVRQTITSGLRAGAHKGR